MSNLFNRYRDDQKRRHCEASEPVQYLSESLVINRGNQHDAKKNIDHVLSLLRFKSQCNTVSCGVET